VKNNRIKSIEDLIVFEDDRLLAINKPFGISSLHERSGNSISIIELLKAYNPDAQLCHRLDRETTGVLLASKNSDTYRDIAIAFEKRQVAKTYFAVVHGQHRFENLNIELPLSITSRGKAKVDMRRGKSAHTIFNTVENFKNFSSVECKPISGRLHQIRVHLASQNAPIVADETYGGKLPYLSNLVHKHKIGREREDRPMIRRVVLHAYRIALELGTQKYEIEAPLSKDIDVFLKLLRKNDSLRV